MKIVLKVVLSADQEKAMQDIQRWFRSGRREQRMGGLAGTGKTTLIAQLPERLNLRPQDIRYCAPTGKAANVLSRKLGQGVGPATTIHKLIYITTELHCERCPTSDDFESECHGHKGCDCCFVHTLGAPDPMPKLIVVDEASMVDETIYQHLQSLGTKVLYVGDHGQLPPVKSRFNLMAESKLDIKLENIHRQAEQSPILLLANEARRNRRITEGWYGEEVFVVSKADLALPGEVYQPGDEPDHVLVLDEDLDTLMICATNKTRVRMNRLVREALGFPADRPVVGDRVICLRNNWEAGIVNGTTGIIRVLKRETPALHYAEIEVLGEDRLYKGLISASQFDSVETELGRARDVDLWTYGYCLTCHKSQGSEADKVIVIEEYLGWMKGQQNRWRYTAYTRAKQELTVIRYGRSESVDRIGVATYNPFVDA